jgi:hypothetical protein
MCLEIQSQMCGMSRLYEWDVIIVYNAEMLILNLKNYNSKTCISLSRQQK